MEGGKVLSASKSRVNPTYFCRQVGIGLAFLSGLTEEKRAELRCAGDLLILCVLLILGIYPQSDSTHP